MEIAIVDMFVEAIVMFNPALKLLKLDDKWEILAFQKKVQIPIL